MGNLIEIQSQIEKLQKQAAEIKSREFDKTVKQIIAMMEAYGITLRDLQQAGGKSSRKTTTSKRKSDRPSAKKAIATKAAPKSPATKGAKLSPKYRGPNGETWSGRGSMPRWMAELVAAGKSRESFAV
jgi:DNA-binding protein H-NS